VKVSVETPLASAGNALGVEAIPRVATELAYFEWGLFRDWRVVAASQKSIDRVVEALSPDRSWLASATAVRVTTVRALFDDLGEHVATTVDRVNVAQGAGDRLGGHALGGIDALGVAAPRAARLGAVHRQ
jgi:hypothetical protein